MDSWWRGMLTARCVCTLHLAIGTVYQYSKANTEIIASAGHAPLFGVDATVLSAHFGGATFDRIQFNFPHWRGKANNRYNR